MNGTRRPGRAIPQAEGPGSTLNPDGTRNAHAVVVGINRYASEQIRDLQYARADAEAVAAVLTDPELGRFPPDNVALLLDEKATQRSIISAIGTGLRRSAKEEDLVCVYFAGHGAVEPNPASGSVDGTSKYLMAADTDPNDLFATAVGMDRVQVFFRRIFAKQVIFLLDSCYSGGADSTPYRSSMSNDFLEQLGEGEGRLILTSCSPNELSLERADYGGGHGLFTHHLLEGLKGPADLDGDGLVTLDELYTYVHDRVREKSRQAGGSMTPMRTGSSTGHIFLTAYQTEDAKKAEGFHEAAQTSFAVGDLIAAQKAWEEALRLNPGHGPARDGLQKIRGPETESAAAGGASGVVQDAGAGRLRRVANSRPAVVGLSIALGLVVVAVVVLSVLLGIRDTTPDEDLSGGSSAEAVQPVRQPPPADLAAERRLAFENAPSRGDAGWPLDDRLSFNSGWITSGTYYPEWPLLAGHEVELTPSDETSAAGVVLYGGLLSPPYRVEFEYLIGDEEVDEGAGYRGGMVVMVHKDPAPYDGAWSVGASPMGFIEDGTGYGIRFTSEAIEIIRGDGLLLAGEPQDATTRFEWVQAAVEVGTNYIAAAAQVPRGQALQAIGPLNVGFRTLGFAAATGSFEGERRVRNVFVKPIH